MSWWLATLLRHVNLFEIICSKVKSKNIKIQVLTCVEAGGSDVYSEGVTSTSCFVKKKIDLGI